ncbi:MAG: PAS domain-containing sensor histidine kinase, partial [Bacteroidota bacterium]|nr:PAS domain-containing sensor histidine kinase [Bacteroidota bacterium]
MHTVDGVLINEFGGKKNKIIYANKELCRLFNVDLNSVFGNNIMSFLSLFNIDNELGQELLVQINKNNNYKREFYFHDHSGKSLCFLLKAYPLIKSLKSSTTYFVTTFTDITEKTKEEKLLNEKLIELNSFVYKACHDIKGPLASIQGLSNLGIEQIKDTQAIKLFKTIKESTDRLDNVLTELLLLSNLEHGVRKFEELDIAQIIDTIIESYQFSKAYENIKMKFNYAANAKIVSDPLSVKSIIQNIIDNAIKYKNQQLAEAEILIETVDYKQGVLLSIYDNGVGIEEFQIKKIFEMFYRGNTSSKGTGLGLYIVKKSLEKIGGTISVQSQINKGSKFLIYLPSKYNRNE